MNNLENIVIFDTSYGSYNQGDFIINKYATDELKYLINDKFVYRVGTHNPVAHNYQILFRRNAFDFFENAKYKFLTGTNIINPNMRKIIPSWNVNLWNYLPYKNVILMGCGLAGNPDRVNGYTKKLLKKILNTEYIHSTRDEKTKKFLQSIGCKAINTGCPTIWGIDEELCKNIPTQKSDSVIFTLTDYCKNLKFDQDLINILNNNYRDVYFWIQGSKDYEYLKGFDNLSIYG